MDSLLEEVIMADGRRYRVAWFDPPFLPPLGETTQALGICFTAERQIVLVTWNGNDWSLPGGTVEPGEKLEQTLAREVREEACARVVSCRYIGCQGVEELDGDRGCYYQTRFWAQVELEPFRPEHEMTARRLVSPEDFRTVLFWGGEATAGLILERGLEIEQSGVVARVESITRPEPQVSAISSPSLPTRARMPTGRTRRSPFPRPRRADRCTNFRPRGDRA